VCVCVCVRERERERAYPQNQGTLTEGQGSVQFTSSLRQLVLNKKGKEYSKHENELI
jgi:hypothetical protein